MNKKILIILLIIPVSFFCSAMSDKRSSHIKTYSNTNHITKLSKSLRGNNNKQQRYLTYNASLDLVISKKSWEKTLLKIINYTKKQGGYISSQTLSSINLKVPSSKFKESFNYFKKLGVVDDENISVEDIGEAYTDTKVRLDNSLELQKRLKHLLDRAANVAEAVKVEKELSRVTERIEILKSRMRLYQNRLDYSTINIDFIKPESPGPLGWVFYGAYKAVKWLIIWD